MHIKSNLKEIERLINLKIIKSNVKLNVEYQA